MKLSIDTELLAKLADEAGFSFNDPPSQDLLRFAEAIVRHCAAAASIKANHPDDSPESVVLAIFGLEQ